MSDVLADAEKQYAAAKSRRARIEKAWKAAARADFTRNEGIHGSSPGVGFTFHAALLSRIALRMTPGITRPPYLHRA